MCGSTDPPFRETAPSGCSCIAGRSCLFHVGRGSAWCSCYRCRLLAPERPRLDAATPGGTRRLPCEHQFCGERRNSKAEGRPSHREAGLSASFHYDGTIMYGGEVYMAMRAMEKGGYAQVNNCRTTSSMVLKTSGAEPRALGSIGNHWPVQRSGHISGQP